MNRTPSSPPTNNVARTTIAEQIELADLKAADGLNGHKCYVAVNGTVYDATNAKGWRNGQHTESQGLVSCGMDASTAMSRAPHGSEVFDSLTIVGHLGS